MTCRLASVDARTRALICECGYPAFSRGELHDHLYGPTLTELVEEVARAWAVMDRAWAQWRLELDRRDLHREEWAVG